MDRYNAWKHWKQLIGSLYTVPCGYELQLLLDTCGVTQAEHDEWLMQWRLDENERNLGV